MEYSYIRIFEKKRIYRFIHKRSMTNPMNKTRKKQYIYYLSTRIRHPCLTIFYICTKAVIIGNPLAASSNTKQSYFHIITFGEKDVSNLSKQCNMNLVLKKCQHLAVVKIKVSFKNATKRFEKKILRKKKQLSWITEKLFPFINCPMT